MLMLIMSPSCLVPARLGLPHTPWPGFLQVGTGGENGGGRSLAVWLGSLAGRVGLFSSSVLISVLKRWYISGKLSQLGSTYYFPSFAKRVHFIFSWLLLSVGDTGHEMPHECQMFALVTTREASLSDWLCSGSSGM